MNSMKNIADLYHAKHGHFPNLSTLSMAEIHALHAELRSWKERQAWEARKEQTVIKSSTLSVLSMIVPAITSMLLGLIIAAQTTPSGQLLMNENPLYAFTALSLAIGGNMFILLALTRKPN